MTRHAPGHMLHALSIAQHQFHIRHGPVHQAQIDHNQRIHQSRGVIHRAEGIRIVCDMSVTFHPLRVAQDFKAGIQIP